MFKNLETFPSAFFCPDTFQRRIIDPFYTDKKQAMISTAIVVGGVCIPLIGIIPTLQTCLMATKLVSIGTTSYVLGAQSLYTLLQKETPFADPVIKAFYSRNVTRAKDFLEMHQKDVLNIISITLTLAIVGSFFLNHSILFFLGIYILSTISTLAITTTFYYSCLENKESPNWSQYIFGNLAVMGYDFFQKMIKKENKSPETQLISKPHYHQLVSRPYYQSVFIILAATLCRFLFQKARFSPDVSTISHWANPPLMQVFLQSLGKS